MSAFFIIRGECPAVRKTAADAIIHLPDTGVWEVSIDQRISKKTRVQEKYLHALLSLVSAYSGHDITWLKRSTAWRLDLVDEIVMHDGEIVRVPRHTRDMNVKDYSLMIEASRLLCEELGLGYPDAAFYGYDL